MCYSMQVKRFIISFLKYLHQSNEIESNDIEPSQSKSNRSPTQPTDMIYCKCSKSEWAYHMHPCKPP